MSNKIIFLTCIAVIGTMCLAACSHKGKNENNKSIANNADSNSSECEYYDPDKVGLQYYDNSSKSESDDSDELCDTIVNDIKLKYGNGIVNTKEIQVNLSRIYIDSDNNTLNMDFEVCNETDAEVNVNCSHLSYDMSDDLSDTAISGFKSSASNDTQTISFDIAKFSNWPENNDLRTIGSLNLALNVTGNTNITGDTYMFPIVQTVLASNSVYDTDEQTINLDIYVSDYLTKSNSSVVSISAESKSDHNISYDLGNKCLVNGEECDLDAIVLCNSCESNLNDVNVRTVLKSGDKLEFSGTIKNSDTDEIYAENVDLSVILP